MFNLNKTENLETNEKEDIKTTVIFFVDLKS